MPRPARRELSRRLQGFGGQSLTRRGAGAMRQPCRVAPPPGPVLRPAGRTAAPGRRIGGGRPAPETVISSAARARRPISRGAAASASGSSSSMSSCRAAGPRQHRRGRQFQRFAGPGQMGGGIGDARAERPASASAGSSARMRAAGKAQLAIHRVFQPVLSAGLEIIAQARARRCPAAAAPAQAFECRQRKGRQPPHGAQAVQPAAARQPQQKGLGLVVLVMRHIERGDAMPRQRPPIRR